VLPAGIDPDYPDDLDGICESIRLLTGISMEALQKAIAVLISPIGWLEEFSSKEEINPCAVTPLGPGDHAGTRIKQAPPAKRTPEPKRHRMPVWPDSQFDAFWEVYPRKVGKDATCREWISFDCDKQAERVFACLDRYLKSREVAQGVVRNPGSTADKLGWLADCAHDNWDCDWPTKSEEGSVFK
jgi:hypothetical protein